MTDPPRRRDFLLTSLSLRSTNRNGAWGTTTGLAAARYEGGYTQASVSGALPNPAVVSAKTNTLHPVIVGLAS